MELTDLIECAKCSGSGFMGRDWPAGSGRRTCSECHGVGTLPPRAPTDHCASCGGVIGFVECPTGSWWAHEVHPADDHDAESLRVPGEVPFCAGRRAVAHAPTPMIAEGDGWHCPACGESDA